MLRNLVVVDDDDYVLERVQRSLAPLTGWTLTSFLSPLDAIGHLRGGTPDVLMMDQRMHPLFGLEVLTELSQDVDLASFRSYIMSIVPLMAEEADQARSLGVTELDKERLRSAATLRQVLEPGPEQR